MSCPRKKSVGPRQLRRRTKAETDQVFASVPDDEFLIGEDEIDLNETVIILDDSSDSKSYCSSESSTATDGAIADAVEFDLPSPGPNNADSEVLNPVNDKEEDQHCLIYVRKDLFTAASYDDSSSSSSDSAWFVSYEEARKKLQRAVERTDLESEAEVDKRGRACRKRRNPVEGLHDCSTSDMDEEGTDEEDNLRKHKRGKVQSSGSVINLDTFNEFSEKLASVTKKTPQIQKGVQRSEQPLSSKNTVPPSDACKKVDSSTTSIQSQNGGRGKENQQKGKPERKTGAIGKKSLDKSSDKGAKPSGTQGPSTSKASEQSFQARSHQPTQNKEPSNSTKKSFGNSSGLEAGTVEQNYQQANHGGHEQALSPPSDNNGATRINQVADFQQLPDRTLNHRSTSTPNGSDDEDNSSARVDSPLNLGEPNPVSDNEDSFNVSLNDTIKDNFQDIMEEDRSRELPRSPSPIDIAPGNNQTNTGAKKRPQEAHLKVLSSKQLQKITVHDILKVQYERQSRMEEEVRAMRTTLEEMRQLLLNRSDILQHPKGFPTLPLKTFDDARIAEDLVKHNSAMKDYLVKKLSFASRGNSDSECSKKIMALLMSNHTGTFFNWKGQNNKQAFSEWALKDIVLQTLKNLRPEMDSKTAENGIKEWCKSRKFAKNNVF